MEQNVQRSPNIYSVASKVITRLIVLHGEPEGKATLARLRNSIGKPLSETVNLWPFMFDQLPEEYLGQGASPSHEERAILSGLQLYALYQQGVDKPVLKENIASGYQNMGTALRYLRNDGETSTDRRFNALITSSTYEEFFHHLRQMVSLLKAKSKGAVQINFAGLINDLYWFLRGKEENLRLSWSREYYRNPKPEEKEGEKNDNE